MKQLTTNELISVLLNVKGSNFVSIESETEPKLKKGNPFNGLVKISRINGIINFLYQNSVNNQRLREGKENNFEPLPRKWGQKIQGTPLIVNKDQYYLELKVEKSDSEYIMNGKPVDYESIKPYTYSSKSRQDLDKEVILRDYNLSSIRKISLQGETYVLSNC